MGNFQKMIGSLEQEALEPVYLVVDGETVYELPCNAALTIGRLNTNQVVLDDYKVSREHALIKYNGGSQVMLIDLASTHGTFLGEEQITQCQLPFNTKFHIVSHELEVVQKKPNLKNADQPVQVVQSSGSRKLDRRVKFFGGLNEFCLLTLVQFLYQEKQCGLLMLELGQKPGPRLYFREGEIIHVNDPENNLSELMTRTNHDQSLFFYFHHETEFPARTIFQSTPNFLMELCHSQDIRAGNTIQLPKMNATPKAESEPRLSVA